MHASTIMNWIKPIACFLCAVFLIAFLYLSDDYDSVPLPLSLPPPLSPSVDPPNCVCYHWVINDLYRTGFFSYFNNMLNSATNAYLDPNACTVKAPSSLIHIHTWLHRSFYDMLNPLTRGRFVVLHNESDSLIISSDNTNIVSQLLHPDTPWRETAQHFPHQYNILEIYQTKSRLAQLLWVLEPELETLVHALRRDFAVTVHIRGGDATQDGRTLFPMQRYVDATLSYLPQHTHPTRMQHVFVMTDDPTTIPIFTRLLLKQYVFSNTVKVRSLDSLWNSSSRILNNNNRWWAMKDITAPVRVDGSSMTAMSATMRRVATLRLVLDMTLAAYGARVVCTLSSNVCRALVLLHRNVGNITIYNLDGTVNSAPNAGSISTGEATTSHLSFQHIHSLDVNWYPY